MPQREHNKIPAIKNVLEFIKLLSTKDYTKLKGSLCYRMARVSEQYLTLKCIRVEV